jgi:hypothetical protein
MVMSTAMFLIAVGQVECEAYEQRRDEGVGAASSATAVLAVRWIT